MQELESGSYGNRSSQKTFKWGAILKMETSFCVLHTEQDKFTLT